MYGVMTYFGNCTLEVISHQTDDDGKTITVVGGNRTFTSTLANGKAIFKGLPSRNKYIITLLNNGSEEYSNEISLGFGEYKIYELNEPVYGMKKILLWENGSPTAWFSAQTITTFKTDFSKYRYLLIESKFRADHAENVSVPILIDKEHTYARIYTVGYNTGETTMRTVTFTDTSITFGSGQSQGHDPYDVYCIPMRIYGLEGEIQEVE